MPNILLEKVIYKVEKTGGGTWRSHLTEGGSLYREYVSEASIAGWPLVHITLGRNPETGRRKVARGVIAIGRIAVGGLAIGQLSVGLVAVGQAGLGLLFGLGQAATGFMALGQLALTVYFAVGQIAVGDSAIGQLAVGSWAIGQLGVGGHVCDTRACDPEVIDHFRSIKDHLTGS